MTQIHIRSLDLNLLKVLEALLEEGGVTPAARRLGLSQSAVSHALNRLRKRIGDPLFVRTPTGMRPTPRALDLGAQVRPALAQLEAALEPARFDPAGSRRVFTLSAGGYPCQVLLPELLSRFHAAAPLAELRTLPPGAGAVAGLDQGRLDLAIGAFGRAPDRYGKQALFEDSLVWVVRAGHALAGAPLTLERLVSVPHVVVATGEAVQADDDSLVDHGLERLVRIGGGEALQAALMAQGLTRHAAASAPDSRTALEVVARTDMAALLPRRLADTGDGRFKLFEPPHPAPRLALSMVWRREQDSPAAAWLRGLAAGAAKAL